VMPKDRLMPVANSVNSDGNCPHSLGTPGREMTCSAGTLEPKMCLLQIPHWSGSKSQAEFLRFDFPGSGFCSFRQVPKLLSLHHIDSELVVVYSTGS
jgi:hypothetical protein